MYTWPGDGLLLRRRTDWRADVRQHGSLRGVQLRGRRWHRVRHVRGLQRRRLVRRGRRGERVLPAASQRYAVRQAIGLPGAAGVRVRLPVSRPDLRKDRRDARGRRLWGRKQHGLSLHAHLRAPTARAAAAARLCLACQKAVAERWTARAAERSLLRWQSSGKRHCHHSPHVRTRRGQVAAGSCPPVGPGPKCASWTLWGRTLGRTVGRASAATAGVAHAA
jgi:hypothetical protein